MVRSVGPQGVASRVPAVALPVESLFAPTWCVDARSGQKRALQRTGCAHTYGC